MRVVAIDLGDRRTGLAMGDRVTGLVTPLEVLEVPIQANGGAALVAAVLKAADRHAGPDAELLLGLPLNMDGTEGPRSATTRAFGARLQEHSGRAVTYHDERLTSVEAEWQLNGTGLTRGQKKRKRDALAAAALLRAYLQSESEPGAKSGAEPGAESGAESGEDQR